MQEALDDLALISIHALHEESDDTTAMLSKLVEFQSTLSMRRATASETIDKADGIFQSTLSMRRAIMRYGTLTLSMLFQSTLSMRRAMRTIDDTLEKHLFQSTLSMRRATQHARIRQVSDRISIHALHEESD